MDHNPALAAFVASFDREIVFGQVCLQRAGGGFEIRHIIDREMAAEALRTVPENEIRSLAQYSAGGTFRALKSTPNLKSGWRIVCRDAAALGDAVNKIYPGAVADWFAAQSPEPLVTSYRDFTARQTGMYRVTTSLDDCTAAAGIRACCHKDFCLKRRLWTVGGLPAETSAEKSLIPCLEPCAVMLEFARKIVRWEQEGGLQTAAVGAPGEAGDMDFDAPSNPRRQRFLLEKQGGGG